MKHEMFDVKNDKLVPMTLKEVERYEKMMKLSTKGDMAAQWILHIRECPLCTKTEELHGI